MANDRLRHAMHHAGLEVAELARRAEVDEKTIRRWLAKDDLVPHPRNRILICRLLNTDEADLWPQLRPTPLTADLGSDGLGDLIAVHIDPVNAPDWRELTADAQEHIDLLDMTLAHILTGPADIDLLAAAASRGAQIRVLLSDPDSLFLTRTRDPEPAPGTLAGLNRTIQLLAGLRDTETIRVRTFVTPPAHSLLRIDDRQLITLQLSSALEPDPILELSHASEDGLFTRFVEHFDALFQSRR